MKNFASNVGRKVLRDQSMFSRLASVIKGAATIITTNSMDMINMAEPASVASCFNRLTPLPARYIAIRKITRQISCSTVVFMSLARLS